MNRTDVWCPNCERIVSPQTTASGRFGRQLMLGIMALLVFLPFHFAAAVPITPGMVIGLALLLAVVGFAAYRSWSSDQHCPICKSRSLEDADEQTAEDSEEATPA